MRNILSALVAAILATIFFSSAAMAQGKVMKDENGFFVSKSAPVDTGVVLEEGLHLTTSQLQEVMNGGRIVTKSSVSEVWGQYYLYRTYTTAVQEEIQEVGKVVKRVSVDKKQVEEKFNPLLPSASLYVILMLLSNFLIRRGSNTALALALAAAAAALAAPPFAVALAAAAAVVAVVAADPTITSAEVKISNKATIIGIVAMVTLVMIGLVN